MTGTPKGPPPEEREAVLAVRQGRKEAFRLLVENHWERVHNLLRRFLNGSEPAEDLCQEAFLQAFTALGTFDETRPFGPWMNRVAVTTALQYRRKQGRQVVLVPFEEVVMRNQVSGPGEKVLGQMVVDEFLARLPESYRLLFLMRYALDLTYEEISQFLAEPVGSVKGNLFRARELLKQAVGEPAAAPRLASVEGKP
ncbi:MAG: sigma-70 family RNA polymerase sigma factor [Candidatus Riflebacteria bacterium]|nr:sigma-70 family RNA polymerase sigma factor [Candidatus Riflebacteria bacterium]